MKQKQFGWQNGFAEAPRHLHCHENLQCLQGHAVQRIGFTGGAPVESTILCRIPREGGAQQKGILASVPSTPKSRHPPDIPAEVIGVAGLRKDATRT